MHAGTDGGGAVDSHVDLDGGRDGGLRRGISAITLSTVEMTLAPGILKMTIRWRLSTRRCVPEFCCPIHRREDVATLSETVPRSEMRTGAPLCLL